MRGVKDGEGLARRYRESRARVSAKVSLEARPEESAWLTFMVCVEDVLVGVAQGELVGNGRLLPPVLLPPSSGAVCRDGLEKVTLCLWSATWWPC